MSTIKVICVSAVSDGWAVSLNGKPLSVHRTRDEAIGEGRRIAERQRAELVAYGANGKVNVRDSSALMARPIPDSIGKPSVSHERIAAVIRAVVLGEKLEPRRGAVKSSPRVSRKRRTA